VNHGTLKALGKTSEELVFLLRACGQYTVEVAANEYGANLANALLSAQAGASTKLRNAGFRQKVTARLALLAHTGEPRNAMPCQHQTLSPAPMRSWISTQWSPEGGATTTCPDQI